MVFAGNMMFHRITGKFSQPRKSSADAGDGMVTAAGGDVPIFLHPCSRPLSLKLRPFYTSTPNWPASVWEAFV